jgi:predicted GNAT family acetyltransferase
VTQRWPEWRAFDFYCVNDEAAGLYRAFLGNTERARLSYIGVAEDRLLLLSTSVLPAESRQLDTATELVRRVLDELLAWVLDDVQESGKKIIVVCPVVNFFTTRNPQYLDLIDDTYPGCGTHTS